MRRTLFGAAVAAGALAAFTVLSGRPLPERFRTVRTKVTDVAVRAGIARKPNILENPVTAHVPEDAVSIAVCDLTAPAAAELAHAPVNEQLRGYINDPALVDRLSAAIGERAQGELRPFFDAARNILRVLRENSWITDPQSYSAFLHFEAPGAGDTGTHDVAGMLLTREPMAFGPIASELQKAGVDLSEESHGSSTLYTVDVKKTFEPYMPANVPDALPAELVFYFGTSASRFAYATSRTRLISLLEASPQPHPLKIRETPHYKQLMKVLPGSSSHFCASYSDVREQLVGSIETLRSRAGASANDPSLKGLFDTFSQFPLASMASVSGFDRGKLSTSAILIDSAATRLDIAGWLKPFEVKGKSAGLARLPERSIFAVHFQGSTLRELRDKVSSVFAPSQTARRLTDLLTGVSYIVSALVFVPGEEILPELSIVLGTEHPEQALAVVRELPAQLLGPNAQQYGTWIDKRVNGVPVHYIASPFGFGLFVAEGKNVLFLSSSEVGVTRLIRQDGAGKSLETRLRDTHAPSSDGSFAYAYFSFIELETALSAVSASAAQLTQQTVSIPDDLKRLLRSSGSFGVAFKYADSAFQADMRQYLTDDAARR